MSLFKRFCSNCDLLPTVDRSFFASFGFLLVFASIWAGFSFARFVAENADPISNCRKLMEDIHSTDRATRLSACRRVGFVIQDLVNARSVNTNNRDCIIEMEGRIRAALEELAANAATRDEKFIALIGLANSSGQNNLSDEELIREAFYSYDVTMINLAMSIIDATPANRDWMLRRILSIGEIPDCRVAVLEKLQSVYEQSNCPWGSDAPKFAIYLARGIGETANDEEKLAARKLLALPAFAEKPWEDKLSASLDIQNYWMVGIGYSVSAASVRSHPPKMPYVPVYEDPDVPASTNIYRARSKAKYGET